MRKYLFPDIYVDTVLHLPLDILHKRGIRAFILDLDNTVTEWNQIEIAADVVVWMQRIKEMGFSACIVSNNNTDRVVTVAESLGIPFVSKARKPRRRAFLKAMEIMEVTPGETAVVGDQVFTDVLGGNRLNLLTILVVPIHPHEFIGTQMMRRIERFVLMRIRRAIKRGEINALLNEKDPPRQ